MESGARIGAYEVLSLLGRGGMGEVYRARDTALRRDVALKILPDAFSADPDRLARFTREAQVLASLSHANIAAIYGLEKGALVLELVEGPTLADRIAVSAIPIGEALSIARQIADALDAAHEKGIIHRDLKPANIKVTPDGIVKVLDFGLAKTGGGTAALQDVTNSPTLTIGPTGAGMVLGTAPYMSPEQARGLEADKRSDIWAFGCVLYEMLTARRAFDGMTTSDVIAAILEREATWTTLPAATPPGVRRLIQRCLEKDSKRRLHDIADARLEIDDALAAPAIDTTAGMPVTKTRNTLAWAAALLLSIVATGIIVWTVKPGVPPSSPTPPSVARLVIVPPEPLPVATEGALTISPDGRRIAFVAGAQGQQRLYVRDIDQFESKPIPGTEGADSPRFSPDGKWLAFVAERKLKKVAVNGGGAVTTVADFTEGRGLTWGPNDTILFNLGRASGIWQVPVAGGKPTAVTALREAENEHNFPEVLPDGKTVLFSANIGAGGFGSYQINVQSLQTGERHAVGSGIGATYLPTGHIVYLQNGTLFAVPFDPVRLETTGEPVAVLQGVAQTPFGAPLVGFSEAGLLAYVAAGLGTSRQALVWVDRRGVESATQLSGDEYTQPRLSPDGRRIAATVRAGSGDLPGGSPGDVWIYDITRATKDRLTFDGLNQFPVWTPDGRQITFSSAKAGPFDIYLKALDSSAVEERFFGGGDGTNYPMSWSPDGQVLAFVSVNPMTANDIWTIGRGDNGKAQPFLRTMFREGAPAISPDGRWVAYASDRSGRTEIYMRPFSGPGEQWTVSTEGGNEPIWARNAKQLFYREGDRMMAVDVTPGPPVAVGKPHRLFEGRYRRSPGFWANYDVSADGQRFLMVKNVDEAPAPTQINVVLNWFDELKRLVPSGRH